MRVNEIMTSDPACCTRDSTLPQVARMMLEFDCGAIPVVEDKNRKRPVGIITDRDIVCRTIAQGKVPSRMTAGDCMTPSVVTAHPETDLEECSRLMRSHQIRRILVVDDNHKVCGIVAQADIAKRAPEGETAHVVHDVSS